MSLFSGPVEHAANSPETWVVTKVGVGHWALQTKGGVTLTSSPTKKGAEYCQTEGFFVTLYAKESRWYAGEQVDGWKPYVPAKES